LDLVFEVGDESKPVGHALVYFTAPDGEIFATYVQTFPIPMNLAQYLPQVFASMVPADQIDAQTATAMPPVAQTIEGGVAWLQGLAESRRDDLLNAGSLYSTDGVNLMGMTQEAVAAYAALYRARVPIEALTVSPPTIDHYADLTEGERLTEMTKLVGRLRDSLGSPEGNEVQSELGQLAATLPSKYRTEDLVRSAATPGPVGQELASLHLQRAYKLLNEDYLELADIERQIRELQVG